MGERPLIVEYAEPLIAAIILVVVAVAVALLFRLRRVRHQRASAPRPLSERDAYLLAVERLLDSDQDGAIDALTQVVQLNTESLQTYFALGQLLRRRGELERSIGLHRSLVVRPSLPTEARHRALMALGEDYRRVGMLDRAAETLGQLLEADPDDLDALEALREVLVESHDWEGAIAVQERAVKVAQRQRGKDVSATRVLAHLWARYARDQWRHEGNEGRAKKSLKKAVKADERCAEAYVVHAEIAANQGKHKDAAHGYADAIEAAPQLAAELTPKLRRALEHAGRDEELVPTLRRIQQGLERRSANTHTVDIALARALALQAEVDEAESLLRGVLRHDPTRHEARRDLLELLQAGGRSDAIREEYQELLDQLVRPAAQWRCQNCGHTSATFAFRCTSCQAWDSFRPVTRAGAAGDAEA